MCLFFYIVTVVGNLLIIMTITLIKTMNAPMYFFLATLSFMDVTYSSSSSPRLISDLLFGENTTSFETCMTQHFIEHSFQWIKSLPSLAICKPLQFLVIMRQKVHVALLLLSCVGGFLHSVFQLNTIYGFPFCGPNVTDHFVCDMYPLLELIGTDTYFIGLTVVANGGLICTIVFLYLSPMESSCTL